MKLTPEQREVFRRIGRKGGNRAAQSMTPEQRKERAQKAARARWTKKGQPN